MYRLKKYLPKFLKSNKTSLSDDDVQFHKEMCKLFNHPIKNISFYREALTVKNTGKSKKPNNYERLEFLGDAVLGSIISCHLYSTYPEEDEGYLTQMKSKIVNRKNLNKLGEDLGLLNYVNTKNLQTLSDNINGNLLESLIGALYLDLGYDACRSVILERLLTPRDINRLENKIVSYKGLLLEWSQKKKLIIQYDTCEENMVNQPTAFRCIVFLENEKISNATASSKKKAEEKAAQRAFYVLNKKKNIIENSKNIT